MRILIVRLSSLGDIVTSMAVLQFIKKKYPDAQIEWLVDSRFTDVLIGNPDLEAVHSIPLKKNKRNPIRALYEVWKMVRQVGHFDLIIDMQGLMKSALLSRAIGKNIVGFDRKSAKESFSAFFYKTKVPIAFGEHILKRNFSLLEESLGIRLTLSEIMQKKPYLPYQKPSVNFDAYFDLDKKNIVAILGGSWASKIYPKQALKEVILRLKENVLVLWSNPEEHERAKWIVERCPNARLLPKMSLNDVKALIDRADVILGNDTGPTHMAWALGKPSVTILGCTSITRIAENEKNLCVTSKICVNPSKINKKDLSINAIPSYEIVRATQSLL